MDREPHWIKENRQERMPPRMVAFDTESRSRRTGKAETQTWRVGCAIRWRNDLRTGDHAEGRVFEKPENMWAWVSGFCRKETRTVAWAHNLGHDLRISQALTILPRLGFTLEWCNLDRNVSAMTWRSDHGTLILADTWTWLPVSLKAIGPGVNLVKFGMPPGNASQETWDAYCMRDAQIVYRAVSELVSFIQAEHLGNWQPTGAGMAYTTWRHRFLRDKVLVHDDTGALEAERSAMHTGRAEAWRHGLITDDLWTELDMRNAYLTIGAECDLPRKLHYHCNTISVRQFRSLATRFRVLCKARITTRVPCVPYRNGDRILWPEGTFTSWLWDTEIECALRYGANVKIQQAYVYARGPILRDWENWVRDGLSDDMQCQSPIVRTWLKHSSRALIGRVALRTRSWGEFGDNPDGMTGISTMTDASTGKTFRLMHVGNKTFAETDVMESRDSIPMVTSWIMAECRVRLWDAMNAAGLENIAHVDTDSILVNRAGLDRLRTASWPPLGMYWHVKGSWRTIDITGPRNYTRGKQRVIAGLPASAEQAPDGKFTGEKWASVALDLQARGDGVVTTWHDVWTRKRTDPRRRSTPGAGTGTVSYDVAGVSSSNSPSSEKTG